MSTKPFQEFGSTPVCGIYGVNEVAEFSDDEIDSDDDSHVPKLCLSDAWR